MISYPNKETGVQKRIDEASCRVQAKDSLCAVSQTENLPDPH
jgi:hypothetical protein